MCRSTVGNLLRDKDGVNASLLLCEMADFYKKQFYNRNKKKQAVKPMSQNENAENATYLSIIREQQNTIAFLNKNVEDMQTANKDLQETVKELQATIANLEETIAELTSKLFGASSEQTKDVSAKDGSTEKSTESDPDIASTISSSE